MKLSRRALKCVLDLILVIGVSPLWIPIVGLAGFLAWILMGRPVTFRHKRPGLQGIPFLIVKFRTMTCERDAKGVLLPDERRLTWVGRVLRSTSLDELPELWNVLRGEMSLVGPRPLLMEYLDRYTPRQARRHEVKPGITGWAQVNGRNALSWEEKFELDVWYVDHWSLWLDLKILALTVWQVVSRHGISHPGSATMPEFLGQSHCEDRSHTPA